MTAPNLLLALGLPGAIGPGTRGLVDPADLVATGLVMAAFYAFAEWAERRRIAVLSEKVVPFPGPRLSGTSEP
jgi:hypothetical protein